MSKITQKQKSRTRKHIINVYGITRHYGGPEEGGWWYDWYHCEAYIKTRTTSIVKIARIIKKFKTKYIDEGNIGSVSSGIQYWFHVGRKIGEYASKFRPRYS